MELSAYRPEESSIAIEEARAVRGMFVGLTLSAVLWALLIGWAFL